MADKKSATARERLEQEPKQVTVLEHIDDYGQWQLYMIFADDVSSREAVEWFLKEMGSDIPEEKIKEQDHFTIIEEECRACKINIHNLKTQ